MLFGFRISVFFRPSDFGPRILPTTGFGALLYCPTTHIKIADAVPSIVGSFEE
jgi:hypothetical protein